MKRYLYVSLFCLVIALALIVVMFTMNARADPFLWAGATPNATKWQINFDGVLMDLPVSHVENETAWLKFDLAGIPNGDHFVEVRAGNQWGFSAWFPLAFIKATADVIVNPYISI